MVTTQGFKYAGSKRLLIPQILDLVRSTGARHVWDAFSGTTRVSQALAQSGFQVTSSDAALWSEVLGTCSLLNRSDASEYTELIAHLNAVPPVDGWFTEHYGGTEADQKKPFQRHNTRRLDGIRAEIDRLRLDTVTRCVALTSLMLALDEVDSTLGHFASYLRQWAPRSYKTLELKVPHLFRNEKRNHVLRGDVFDLAERLPEPVDLAYLDPPYGSNNAKMPPSRVRYAAYYHFWTTLIQNDQPEVFGKASRRCDSRDLESASVFEEFRRDEHGRFIAVEAIRRLLRTVPARWLVLSYSSGGRATAEELLDAIEACGTLRQTLKIDYRQNVMAGMQWTREWLRETPVRHQEFLFLVERDS